MDKSRFIKILKILLLNIFFIFLFLFVVDYLLFLKCKNESSKKSETFNSATYLQNYKLGYSFNSLKFQQSEQNDFSYFRNEKLDFDNDKKSVLIFGCSYAYGFGLEDNQTFAYKLANRLKRKVYNFGVCACGVQHMLSFLQNKNFYRKIEKEPEYAIYVWLPSHIHRLQSTIYPHILMNNGLNLRYELLDAHLKLKKYPLDIFSKTFIVKSFYQNYDERRFKKHPLNSEYNIEMVENIFIESQRILKIKYPNIKFIILRYESEKDYAKNLEREYMWDVLSKEGFIVVKTSDLIGRKFNWNSNDTVFDGYHPSEKAWDMLVPKFAEILNFDE